MPEALRIIQREHRNLAAVLLCLRSLVRAADEDGYTPDYAVLEQIFDYLTGFLNRFHHPKESEHLFAALLKRRPDCAKMLGELGKEHGEVAPQLEDLQARLKDCREQGQAAVPALREAVEKYCRFELDHMAREEGEVFVEARESLTPEDWTAIDNAFLANDDPLFGIKRRKEFSGLFTKIVSMTPAPFGLGEPTRQ